MSKSVWSTLSGKSRKKDKDKRKSGDKGKDDDDDSRSIGMRPSKFAKDVLSLFDGGSRNKQKESGGTRTSSDPRFSGRIILTSGKGVINVQPATPNSHRSGFGESGSEEGNGGSAEYEEDPEEHQHHTLKLAASTDVHTPLSGTESHLRLSDSESNQNSANMQSPENSPKDKDPFRSSQREAIGHSESFSPEIDADLPIRLNIEVDDVHVDVTHRDVAPRAERESMSSSNNNLNETTREKTKVFDGAESERQRKLLEIRTTLHTPPILPQIPTPTSVDTTERRFFFERGPMELRGINNNTADEGVVVRENSMRGTAAAMEPSPRIPASNRRESEPYSFTFVAKRSFNSLLSGVENTRASAADHCRRSFSEESEEQQQKQLKPYSNPLFHLIDGLRERHYGYSSQVTESGEYPLLPVPRKGGRKISPDEWEDDDDAGYLVLALSEEEFFQFEEETSQWIMEKRKRTAVTGKDLRKPLRLPHQRKHLHLRPPEVSKSASGDVLATDSRGAERAIALSDVAEQTVDAGISDEDKTIAKSNAELFSGNENIAFHITEQHRAVLKEQSRRQELHKAESLRLSRELPLLDFLPAGEIIPQEAMTPVGRTPQKAVAPMVYPSSNEFVDPNGPIVNSLGEKFDFVRPENKSASLSSSSKTLEVADCDAVILEDGISGKSIDLLMSRSIDVAAASASGDLRSPPSFEATEESYESKGVSDDNCSSPIGRVKDNEKASLSCNSDSSEFGLERAASGLAREMLDKESDESDQNDMAESRNGAYAGKKLADGSGEKRSLTSSESKPLGITETVDTTVDATSKPTEVTAATGEKGSEVMGSRDSLQEEDNSPASRNKSLEGANATQTIRGGGNSKGNFHGRGDFEERRSKDSDDRHRRDERSKDDQSREEDDNIRRRDSDDRRRRDRRSRDDRSKDDRSRDEDDNIRRRDSDDRRRRDERSKGDRSRDEDDNIRRRDEDDNNRRRDSDDRRRRDRRSKDDRSKDDRSRDDDDGIRRRDSEDRRERGKGRQDNRGRKKSGFGTPFPRERRSAVEKRRDEVVGQDLFMGVDKIHACYYLKVIFDPDRTGFEEQKDFQFSEGTIIAGRYEVHSTLGSAAFSTALKCADHAADDDEPQYVCLKLIRNNKDFLDQSLDEIKILQYLNSDGRPDRENFLKLVDYFYFKEHLFIVTELLKENLYEFGRFIRESGNASYYTMPRLKKIMKQALEAVRYVHGLKLIHCDIKPENIVMKSYTKCEIKLIDFGSSCFDTDHLTTYIQSRSYRAPEVILGLDYDNRIDIWSLGAVLAELHTGYVLFQNDSIPTMLTRIIGLLGTFPPYVLKKGTESGNFFSVSNVVYERDEQDGSYQMLFPKITNLRDRLHIPELSRRRKGLGSSEDEDNFYDLVRRMLDLDPATRISAKDALRHPFFTDAGLNVADYVFQAKRPAQYSSDEETEGVRSVITGASGQTGQTGQSGGTRETNTVTSNTVHSRVSGASGQQQHRKRQKNKRPEERPRSRPRSRTRPQPPTLRPPSLTLSISQQQQLKQQKQEQQQTAESESSKSESSSEESEATEQSEASSYIYDTGMIDAVDYPQYKKNRMELERLEEEARLATRKMRAEQRAASRAVRKLQKKLKKLGISVPVSDSKSPIAPPGRSSSVDDENSRNRNTSDSTAEISDSARSYKGKVIGATELSDITQHMQSAAAELDKEDAELEIAEQGKETAASPLPVTTSTGDSSIRGEGHERHSSSSAEQDAAADKTIDGKDVASQSK